MEAKAVDAYRRAEKLGEGLAMSNLGSKFMAAGFHEEAKKLFNEALKTEGTHNDNAWQALTKMKESREKEVEKETEVLAQARQRSEFYRAFGRAFVLLNASHLPSSWRGPECDFVVTLSAGMFSAAGEYERAVNALMRPYTFGVLGGIVEQKTELVRVTYTGVVRGRTIEGQMRTTIDGAPPPSLLSAALESTDVLMAIDDAGQEIRVLELHLGGAVRLYALTSVKRPELAGPA